jgi:hypothetical protein
MSTRRILPAAAHVVALALWLVANDADANDGLHLSIDWGKLGALLHDGAALLPQESWRPQSDGPANVDQKSRSASTQASELRWLGGSPHLSLVARDWSGAQLLVGHLMLTDQVRLSRSCRMVLSRVRLADGRIAPFGQIGLGQWRVDTDLMPAMHGDSKLAGQLGGGFELAVSRRAALALEIDYTLPYHEHGDPEWQPAAQPWVAFVAAHARF